MRKIFARVRADDGSTTMEYAMVTVCCLALAGLLYKAITAPETYAKVADFVLRSIS